MTAPGAQSVLPFAVNDTGTPVGYYAPTLGPSRAFNSRQVLSRQLILRARSIHLLAASTTTARSLGTTRHRKATIKDSYIRKAITQRLFHRRSIRSL